MEAELLFEDDEEGDENSRMERVIDDDNSASERVGASGSTASASASARVVPAPKRGAPPREPRAAGSLPIAIPSAPANEHSASGSDDSGFLPPHVVANAQPSEGDVDTLDALKKSRDLALRTDVLRKTGFLEQDSACLADPRSLELARGHQHSDAPADPSSRSASFQPDSLPANGRPST